MRRLLIGMAFLGLALSVGPAWALSDVVYASPKGADGGGCGAYATPCQTVQGAYDVANPGGAIILRDPGEYQGTVKIAKSISIINGSGGAALLDVGANGSTALTLVSGASEVRLKGLDIRNTGSAFYGLNVISDGTLEIDDCTIEGFQYYGVLIANPTSMYLTVKRSRLIRNGSVGLLVSPTGTLRGTIRDSSFSDNAIGAELASYAVVPPNASFLSIIDTTFTRNGVGVYAYSATGKAAAKVALDGVISGGNGTGLNAGPFSQMTLAHAQISGNAGAGISLTGGSVSSLGDNSIRLNLVDVRGGALPTFAAR